MEGRWTKKVSFSATLMKELLEPAEKRLYFGPLVVTHDKNGPVVELVDALDSKSSVRKDVGVRFSPGPPSQSLNL